MAKFKPGIIYIAKCKRGFCSVVKKGEYVRCMKKGDASGNIRWNTCSKPYHLTDDFRYSWSLCHWLNTFEKPVGCITYEDTRVGESLLCIEDYYMEDGELSFKKGNAYVVSHTDVYDKCIAFTDEAGDKHWMDEENLSYFVKEDKRESLRDIFEEYGKQLSKLHTSMPCYDLLSLTSDSNTPSWKFKDKAINWPHLCNDLIEEDKPLALVKTEDKIYLVGIWNIKYDWEHVFREHIADAYPTLDGQLPFPVLPYEILEVENFKVCQKLCEEYSKKYKNWRSGLKKHIMNPDRDRSKGIEVQVYSY